MDRFQEGVNHRGLITKERARGPDSWCRVVRGPEAGVLLWGLPGLAGGGRSKDG